MFNFKTGCLCGVFCGLNRQLRVCVIIFLGGFLAQLQATPTQNFGNEGSWIGDLGGGVSGESTGGSEGVLRPSWNTPVDGGAIDIPPADAPSTGPITVALSESTIASDFAGIIEITIGGLANGQDVLVERFRVNNSDGIVDAGAVLQRSHRMADGFFERQGEAFNFNIPNDYTERDGEIVAQLDFWSGSIGNVPGEFVYRVSSPGGHFAPVTARLTIIPVVEDQLFYGSVTAAGAPVEGAFVAMLDPLGDYKEFIRGAVTDEDGLYDLKAPFGGEFDLVAVKPGFVSDFGGEIEALLEEGGETAKDFELTPGNRSISGSLVDSVSGEPLAGVLLTVLSIDNENAIVPDHVTIAWTDQDGEFDIPVTAGIWGIFLRLNDAAEIGYLVPANGPLVAVDTTVGDVTGVEIPLARGTTLIAGTLVSNDFFETPLGGIQVIAKNLDTNQAAWGVAEGEGKFRIAVGPGRWSVGPFSYTMELFDHSGAVTSDVFFSGTDQSIEVDFVARERIAEVYGFATNSASEAVGKLQLIAVNLDSNPTETASQSTYGSDGYYNFFFSEGQWAIVPDSIAAAKRALLFKNLPIVNVELFGAQVFIQDIDVEDPTATLRIGLENGNGDPLPGIVIEGICRVGSDVYRAYAMTDANGIADLPAVQGDWEVFVDAGGLRAAGQQSLLPVNVNVDKALAVAGQVTSPLEPTPAFGISLIPSDDRVTVFGSGQRGQQFVVEASPDLQTWFDLGRVTSVDGQFAVEDEIAPFFDQLFYRFKSD